MDAEEYIAKQALGQLEGIRNKKYGAFFPSGGIRIFFPHDTFKEDLYSGSHIFSDEPNSENINFGRCLETVMHESFHFHHILSSPLGFIINFCYEVQIECISIFVTEEIGRDFSYEQFQLYKPYFKYRNQNFRNFLNLQHIRMLFGDQYFLQNNLKISDFVTPLYTYLLFLNDELFKITKEKISVTKIDRLISDVVSWGNNYIENINFTHGWRSDSVNKLKRAHGEISDLYNFSKRTNSLYVSPVNIIESYARICQFFWTYHLLVTPGKGFVYDADYYQKIENEENGVIITKLLNFFRKQDRFAIDFVRYKLGLIQSHFESEFLLLKICSFVFELSLCVPLSPFTLLSRPIKTEELFVTCRLACIVEHINNYFDFYHDEFIDSGTKREKTSAIAILNKITDRLGWVSYTDSLNDLYKTYNKGFILRNNYLVEVANKLIRSKINNLYNPIWLNFEAVHTSQYLMFNDIFCIKARELLELKEKGEKEIRKFILQDHYSKHFHQQIFNDIFMKHLVFADSFKEASKKLKEILPEMFWFEEYISLLLNDSCFSKIITVSDIL